MADLLNTNLSISFSFSLLNLSPHPHFSFTRFSPLNRSRFSHSSLLSNCSAHSSQFHIISQTENSDGSVSFKFGDVSEIAQTVDDSDSGNEIDLVREDNEILDNQGDVVAGDNIDDKFVTNGVKLKEIVEEPPDSVSDAQSCEGFVSGELNNGSTSTAEVENSSDSGEDDDVNNGSTSIVGVENSVDSVEDDEVKNDCAELEYLSDSVKDVLKSVLSSTAEVENLSDSVEVELKSDSNLTRVVENLSYVVEDELKRDSNSTAALENLSDLVQDELIDDSTTTLQVENLDECAEDELESDSTLTAEVKNSSKSVEGRLKSDSVLTAEVSNSSDIDTTKHENPMVDNVVATCDSSVVVMPEKSSELSEASAEISGFDKLENGGGERTMIAETSHSVEENVVEEVDDTVTSDKSEAEQILEKENEGMVTSKQFEAEPIVEEKTSSVSLDGVEFLGSNKDITTYAIAQIDDDCNDMLVAVHPVTSGITLAETSIHSLSKEESLAPAISISSAVASLTHSLEALTGGKDASFVSDNWFGVADGVGQWSFGGVDIGLYAHEFMQNCEKLLKSGSAGSTNVKELLQQSAAMTQSTGSARVLIAHVANQVLHVANIGDSGFLIIRNGTIYRKSSPVVHEFSFPYAIGLGDDSVEDAEEYHIDLEEDDVIITATDGLFDNLYEQEIASIVSKSLETGMHVQDLAELLASKAQEVGRSESARSPYADAAQAAGHPGFSGGKFDHVTVIVSLVQR